MAFRTMEFLPGISNVNRVDKFKRIPYANHFQLVGKSLCNYGMAEVTVFGYDPAGG